jgi:hypothetical protein
MRFIFEQKTTDYYVVEAETEEEALELVQSGEVMVGNTKYEDLNLVKTEEEV